jgi:precorrin-2 dehydrogenase/sirohydrochlorin ferrochelatase
LEDDQIDVLPREYQPGDLAGIGLVIAATDNPATNEAVWQEAQATGCLVNVVDDPDRCNFHVPAIVRRGNLTLSVSTGGNSPALARRIRRSLEQQFDSAYGPYLVLLGELRPLVRQRVASQAQRKMLWESLLDANILELLRAGATEAARERAQEIVESFC